LSERDEVQGSRNGQTGIRQGYEALFRKVRATSNSLAQTHHSVFPYFLVVMTTGTMHMLVFDFFFIG
jgi:hypothetical protein